MKCSCLLVLFLEQLLLKFQLFRDIPNHHDQFCYPINLHHVLRKYDRAVVTALSFDVEHGRLSFEHLHYFFEREHALTQLCQLYASATCFFLFLLHSFGDFAHCFGFQLVHAPLSHDQVLRTVQGFRSLGEIGERHTEEDVSLLVAVGQSLTFHHQHCVG